MSFLNKKNGASEQAKNTEKKSSLTTNAFKGGSYTLLMGVIVLAILIVVNVIMGLLPATWTNFDISSTRLYSITSDTKVVVNNLEEDITIYWICQTDEEDDVIQSLLNKYDSLSSHISVVKRNPDEYPTFAEQYTDDDAANNDLVVVNDEDETYRYISYDDMYPYEVDYSTYSYVYYFDGEGLITSAINYVTTDDLPILYIVEGHGESDLPDDFTSSIEKANYETQTLSLVSENEVPEDADCVLIYAPESDISETEADILIDYVENGGKLMVLCGLVADVEFDNLNSVLEAYDVTVEEGIVIEEDQSYYAFGYPYMLLPEIESSDMTDSLIEDNYYVILPIASGLTVSDDAENVTTLLSSSDTAFSKIDGYEIDTYDEEDDDIDGPFALAVDITTDGDGEMIWIACSYMLEDDYNSYSSGANLDLVMNCVSQLAGETESVTIQSKSLSYNYLTISESVSSMMLMVMIVVIPAAFLIIGIIVIVRRRMKKHE